MLDADRSVPCVTTPEGVATAEILLAQNVVCVVTCPADQAVMVMMLMECPLHPRVGRSCFADSEGTDDRDTPWHPYKLHVQRPLFWKRQLLLQSVRWQFHGSLAGRSPPMARS